ncbi:MAG: quinone oxidoreductase family protein [Hyphomicrobiaceae bacterium]
MLDVATPEPGPGEVLVKVAFAGVNFIDIYLRRGEHATAGKAPSLPRILGREGAGEVVKLGPGVTDVKLGDRVAWCVSDSAYAEYAVVPAWRLVPVPADVALDIACALQLQGSTAHYLATTTFPLKAGDIALVHSGAGGVGQLLIQLAKALGATVIATVGSDAKAAIAKGRGADHVIVTTREDFAAKVLDITKRQGCNVVYDAVGKDTIARSIAACRRRGLVALYGAASGAVDSINPLALAEAGSVFFTRPHLADYMQDATEVRARANDLFGLLSDGRLKVTIDRVYPLASARDAHVALESRTSAGKLLLKVIA